MGIARYGLCISLIVVIAPAVAGAAAGADPCPGEAFAAEPGWGRLPAPRKWGSTSAVYPSTDGSRLWVAERCGGNSCIGSDLDPVLLFDLDGNLLRSFGAGLIAWPHGIFVDAEENVWIADAAGMGAVPEGVGHVVYKFSAHGELLMTLGRRGVVGNGKDTFRKPTDVVVAADGTIFVADGHGSGPGAPANNRIVRFAADGTYLGEFGVPGGDDGELDEPHALAMDSAGRLFVADRGNARILLFDQTGRHLATWTQFGRPSGLYIDRSDVLYVADSESNAARNPGWKRGIRIGGVRDGFVTAFIPDPEPDQDRSPTSGAEAVAVDAAGNVYGAEVWNRQLVRYVPRK